MRFWDRSKLLVALRPQPFSKIVANLKRNQKSKPIQNFGILEEALLNISSDHLNYEQEVEQKSKLVNHIFYCVIRTKQLLELYQVERELSKVCGLSQEVGAGRCIPRGPSSLFDKY